jgi:5-methylcytosine-specific restriction enzyme B
LASGRLTSIPSNLFVVATMNEFDRGVDDVDAAFDRRFAQIYMSPSPDILAKFLANAGMDPQLSARVMEFFSWLQRSQEPAARLGQTFFLGLSSASDLRRRWAVQLSHVLRKAFRLDPDGFREVENAWNAVFE